MKFGSICSGIEAASQAWHPLGFRCAFASEIEPFPSEVLAVRWPDVQNLGDVTQFKHWPDYAIDILVGGTPCQSFSVAGLRAGLADPRGNLALVFLGVVERYRPRWVVWENVPGVHSSWSDATQSAPSEESRRLLEADGLDAGDFVEVEQNSDFDAFLAGLAELGYGIATRVLDAQHFGLAQRRERVFVVGHSGGQWQRAAAVLFDAESLRWNPPKGRETREGTARDVAPSIGASGRGTSRAGESRRQDCVIPIEQVCATLTKNYATHHGRSAGNNGGIAENPLVPSLSPAIKSRDCKGPSSDGDGDGAPLIPVVAHSLNAGRDGYNDGSDQTYVPVAFSVKDHGSDAGELSPTLRAGNHDGSHANGGCGPAIAFQARFFTRDNKTGGADSCGEVIPALSRDHGNGDSAPCVAFQPRIARNGRGDMGEKANALQAASGETGKGDAAPCVASVAGVRRLTPTECERLQGFPDGYTAIPLRGKPAEQCPDGPRYRALGNSMAVPVMRWIGQRIALIEKIA